MGNLKTLSSETVNVQFYSRPSFYYKEKTLVLAKGDSFYHVFIKGETTEQFKGYDAAIGRYNKKLIGLKGI